MAKYKLLKDHLGKTKGESIEVNEGQKQYFIKVGLIAEKESETKEDAAPKKRSKK